MSVEQATGSVVVTITPDTRRFEDRLRAIAYRPVRFILSAIADKPRGHWSDYYPGTGFEYRYRHCRICGKVWRNTGMKPLLKNGRKP